MKIIIYLLGTVSRISFADGALTRSLAPRANGNESVKSPVNRRADREFLNCVVM